MIRSALKRGIKKVLGMEAAPEAAVAPAPVWKVPAPVVDAPVQAAAKSAPPAAAAPDAVAEAVPAPAVEAAVKPLTSLGNEVSSPAEPAAEAPVKAPMAASDDTAGPGFTFEAVQEIMDEMVRPALQGDGGDITLLRIENNDIYVKLVGSCSTCPSSILTMKMGVEALLKEEFPAMNSLIQVD